MPDYGVQYEERRIDACDSHNPERPDDAFSRLNPEQLEAVYGNRRRILCLAGAGTGKTQVLTCRIARLYAEGVSPANMLALTFTRAAGAEMKGRVIGLVGEDGKNLFCNTFHAFCADVLRENASRLGYEPNFSVYGQKEADGVMTDTLSDLKFKLTVKKMNDFRAGNIGLMNDISRRDAQRALKEYRYRLRRANAVNFDGLVETVNGAIKNDPVIFTKLGERYRHVFVDEFQDTDPLQWELINNMKPDNLFVVGDDFQSIYGFRGADVGIILGLAGDESWHTVKLERNYRSTRPIVEAANRLIRHNRQTEKTLKTEKPGIKIHYREPATCMTEMTDIIDRLLSNQTPDAQKTTAILARTNRQVDMAYAILKSNGVPCETLAAADDPLASPGADLMFAWMAAFINPADDEAVRKAARDLLGKTAVLEAEQKQLASGGTFYEAVQAAKKGQIFTSYYERLKEKFESSAKTDIAFGVKRLQDALIARYMFRTPNERDIIKSIGHWAERQAELGEPADAAALLEYVRMRDVAERPAQERGADRTWIMTVHGSKGLEFDEVFIIGAAQGTFPGPGDVEEERRLFYVAMTRAREYLDISCPIIMTGWNGQMKNSERSQFVDEVEFSYGRYL